MVGGTATTGTVTLDGPAPTGGALVPLTGSTSTASWPARVTVPAGANSVSFSVPTARPTTTAFLATVTARYAGLGRQATLWVTRAIPEPVPALPR